MLVLRPAPVTAAPSAGAEDAGGGSLRATPACRGSNPPLAPLAAEALLVVSAADAAAGGSARRTPARRRSDPPQAPRQAPPHAPPPAADVPAGTLPRSRDADLVAQVRAGNEAALTGLLDLYRPLVRARARSYFLVGADRDDVVQEAMIGLFKAIRDFDPRREASFRTFADVCVTRQIVNAVRTATRHKHGPLNDYQSLAGHGGTAREGADLPLEGVLSATGNDPADLVVSRERLRALQTHVDEVLSDLEVRVLRLHLEGLPQGEIAVRLHRSSKAVDNALQRIKRKLSAHLAERTVAEAG